MSDAAVVIGIILLNEASAMKTDIGTRKSVFFGFLWLVELIILSGINLDDQSPWLMILSDVHGVKCMGLNTVYL